MRPLDLVFKIAIFVQALSAASFCVEYQRLTRGTWRRRVIGWHLMMMTAADAVFAGQLAISVIWPSLGRQAWFVWTFVCVMMFTALIVLSRLVILEVEQRTDLDQETRRRRARRAAPPPSPEAPPAPRPGS